MSRFFHEGMYDIIGNLLAERPLGSRQEKYVITDARIIDEDEHRRCYEFAVPGATKETLLVELKHNVLEISYDNRGYTRYLAYTVPCDINLHDACSLTLQDGLLTVSMGKHHSLSPNRKLTFE